MAISLVQSADAGSTGDSVTATFPSTPAEGNLLAAVGYQNGADTPTLPDGWDYAQAVSTSSLADEFWIAWKIAGASEPTAVTFDYSSATENSSLAIGEFYAGDGMAWVTPNPIDENVTNQINTSTSSHSSGTTGTTAQAEELAVAGWGLGGNITGRTYTNSFTEVDYGNFSDTAAAMAYRVLAATATYESTLEWTSGTTHAVGGLVTFLVESATGTTVAPGLVASTVALPSASVAAGSVVPVPTVPVTVALPTPGVSVPSNVAAAVVAAVAALPQATVNAQQAATPQVVTTTVTLPQASVSVPAAVSGQVIGVVASLPVATGDVAVGTEVPAATIAVLVAVPTPATAFGATVQAFTIAVTTTIPQALARAGALLIRARTYGQFQRINQRLHLARVRRSLRKGYDTTEGWERVSEVFVFDEDTTADGSFDQAMAAVVQAWANHQGSDAATLKAAIDSALDGFGFRRPDGTTLT